MAHVDEIPQPVEEVREVVEVALELDRDRDRQVARDRRRGRRGRDLLEGDAAVLRRPGSARAGSPPCRPGRASPSSAGRGRRHGSVAPFFASSVSARAAVDRAVRVSDLAGRGRPPSRAAGRSRRNQPPSAGEQEAERRSARSRAGCGIGASLSASRAAARRRRSTKCTAVRGADLAASVLCWSWTLTRSGTTARRAQQARDGRVRVREAVERELRSRRRWCLRRRPAAATADRGRARAPSPTIVASQTSSGSTSESSRKISVPGDPARERCAGARVTRACLSAARRVLRS